MVTYMTYGLRIWDELGNLTLDINDRTARYHSSFSIPAIVPQGSYSVTLPSGFDSATWFVSGRWQHTLYYNVSGTTLTVYNVNDTSRVSDPMTIFIYEA